MRDLQLWEKIVKATNFLPDTALPKQRCWHILNDTYEQPRCLTTGVPSTWNENRYLTYSSAKAKAADPQLRKRCVETYKQRTGHDGHWSSNPEVKERKLKTFYSTMDTHLPQDWEKSRSKDSSWYQGVQKAWTDEKREETGLKSKEQFFNMSIEEKQQFIQNCKNYWTKEKRHEHSLKMRKPYSVAREYYLEVNFWTNYHWNTKRDIINPNNLERSYWKYQLDHIYTIRDGFRNDIPAKIIGHWTNLQLLPQAVNKAKGGKSTRLLEETLDLYLRNSE